MSKDARKAPLRYFAFLSYRSSDRRLAEWLFRRLETYRLPKDLVGKDAVFGPIPRRLGRIFRDREEARTAEDVETIIAQELSQSEHLIVLCTPSAAQPDAWVGREIELFRERRPNAPIHAVIGYGDPPECFPPQLLSRDAGGRSKQPLAADLRPSGDGREKGFLKLVAGLLGLNFDDLYRRDQRRRARNMLVGAVLGVGLLAGLAQIVQYSLDVDQHRRWQDAWGEADNDYQRLRLALSAQSPGIGLRAPPDPRAVAYLAGLSGAAPALIFRSDFGGSPVLLDDTHVAFLRSNDAYIVETNGAEMRGVDLSCGALNLAGDCALTPFFRARGRSGAFAVATASNAGQNGLLIELGADGSVISHGPSPCNVDDYPLRLANVVGYDTLQTPSDNFCLHALARSLTAPSDLAARAALAASIELTPMSGGLGAWNVLASDYLVMNAPAAGAASMTVVDLETGERRQVELSPCMIDVGDRLMRRPCTVSGIMANESGDRLIAMSEPFGYAWELDDALTEVSAHAFTVSGDNIFINVHAPGPELTFLSQNNETSVFAKGSPARVSSLPAGCTSPVSDQFVVCSIAGALSIWRVGSSCPDCDYRALRERACDTLRDFPAQSEGTSDVVDLVTMQGIARTCQ